MSNFERLTLNDIQDILEEETDVFDTELIIIPNEGINSDGDSGDEDDVDIARLSRNQLLSNAEANFRRFVDGQIETVAIGDSHEDLDITEEETEATQESSPVDSQVSNSILDSRPSTSACNLSETTSNQKLKRKTTSILPNQSSATTKKRKQVPHSNNTLKKNKPDKHTYTWADNDLPSFDELLYELPDWLQTHDGSPIKLFELFYDDAIISLICNYTNLHAQQNGEHNMKLTEAETKVFLAILLLSGYNQVPRARMYWDQSPDCYNAAVANAMSRNRFFQIMRYFHACDNHNLIQNDRFAKVTPLWDQMNEKWLKFYPGDTNLSVDESMIPYYGRHGAKQHMHGKPIRFGFKAWCLCSRLGYLIQSIPYQGRKTGNTHPEIGVGGSVVIDLVSKLPKTNVCIFFDNFFTSIPLMIKLKDFGMRATGTLRANRTLNATLPSKKDMKNSPRGSYSQTTDNKTGVTLVRYLDNNVVTIASTQSGVFPVSKVRRFSQATKSYIQVDQPACFVLYNTYMGGVDRLDENISKLRINIKGKKWYWQLLCFPLNVSVNNAWQLHRYAIQKKSDHLDMLGFTRTICQTYLQKYGQRVALGRPPRLVKPVESRVMEEVRFDSENHFLISSKKQSRCAQCKKNVRLMCKKCNVALHQHCSEVFHTR